MVANTSLSGMLSSFTFSRLTSTYICGTPGRNVVLSAPRPLCVRASSMIPVTTCPRIVRPRSPRSCTCISNPPRTPKPRIAGGATHHDFGAFLRSRIGQLDENERITLVFRGNKASRHMLVPPDRQHDQTGKYEHHNERYLHNPTDDGRVYRLQPAVSIVEPT